MMREQGNEVNRERLDVATYSAGAMQGASNSMKIRAIA